MSQIGSGKIWDSPRTRKGGCLGWLHMAVTMGRRAEGSSGHGLFVFAQPGFVSWVAKTVIRSYKIKMGKAAPPALCLCVEEDNKGPCYCVGAWSAGTDRWPQRPFQSHALMTSSSLPLPLLFWKLGQILAQLWLLGCCVGVLLTRVSLIKTNITVSTLRNSSGMSTIN